MSLKSQLLQFLSQMPITQTVRDRRALLAYVEFERFENKITWEGNNTVFFNELLELLRSEGQSNLVLFLTNLRNSEWIGLDDRNKLAKFADDIQALTKEEWKKKFWGYADSQSLSRVPFVLPQLDESTFTGREEELKQLEEQLFNRFGSHVCSIVGLSGGSGIGKSALACHFATIHKDRFPDGIIGLRVDGKSPDQIARQFVNECLKFSREKFDLEDEQDAATLMQETFAHRRMLLIFDNAVDASLKQLRPGGNLCSVIKLLHI